MGGKAGLSRSQAGSSQAGRGGTGPNPGQGSGERDRGRQEETTFKRERVPAKGLDPRGVSVGSLAADGPSITGEARVEKSQAIEDAVRQLSQEVETEPLPVEHREQIQRFHNLILGGNGPSGENSPEK